MRGAGKGHQGPRMDLGISRVMFCAHACRAAVRHDPCAVCGADSARCSRGQSARVAHAGVPGLQCTGLSQKIEHAERRNLRTKNYDKIRTEHRKYTHTTMHSTQQATALTRHESKHEHTVTHARKIPMNPSLKSLNTRRGPWHSCCTVVGISTRR